MFAPAQAFDMWRRNLCIGLRALWRARPLALTRARLCVAGVPLDRDVMLSLCRGIPKRDSGARIQRWEDLKVLNQQMFFII